MPAARRQRLKALGSLQLVAHANNPTKVITELAFIADERVNDPSEHNVESPLEVQFNEFMDGVNSRGKGTNTRHRKMTVEQAAAILLVTVQKGHVELITKGDDPHTIDVIKILPGAKRILASFLPKLRGYGDIPYDQQYRGAIALAKRHFFPKGNAPTKKDLMALLLQSYQEKKEIDLRRQGGSQPTKTLGTQTSFIDRSSHIGVGVRENVTSAHTPTGINADEVPNRSSFQSSFEQPDVVTRDNKSIAPASEVDLEHDGGEDQDVFMEARAAPIQLPACTPVVSRSFNPYMTPISNPRHMGYTGAASCLLDSSPTPATHSEIAFNKEASTDEDQGVRELLQVVATCQGRLDFCQSNFIACQQRMTFLEEEKEEIEKKLNLTRRKLDETELLLQEANVDRERLKRWVDKLLGQVDTIYSQFGILRQMAHTNPVDGGGLANNPRPQDVDGFS